MKIKLLVAAAAVALTAGSASALAAEAFATLEGITAEAVSPADMSAVRGMVTLTVWAGKSTITDPVIYGLPDASYQPVDSGQFGGYTGLNKADGVAPLAATE